MKNKENLLVVILLLIGLFIFNSCPPPPPVPPVGPQGGGSGSNSSSEDDVVRVSSISFSKSDIYLDVGQSCKIVATISPSNATNKNVTYSSSDYSIATIDENGLVEVKGKLGDSCVISATSLDGNFSARTNVHIIYQSLPLGTIGQAGKLGNYILFGSFPQTVLSQESTVIIDEQNSEKKIVGMYTYYKGSDGNWYCKMQENAYASDYTYSDGSVAKKKAADSYRYFRVEPIKWRVLSLDYNSKRLLLSENILIASSFYDRDFKHSIDGQLYEYNNYYHSKLRAFLNGTIFNDWTKDSSEFLDKGFFQTAFNEIEQAAIYTTLVDNSLESANPDGESMWTHNNFCEDSFDKIFCISLKEITTHAYGFDKFYQEDILSNPTDVVLKESIVITKDSYIEKLYDTRQRRLTDFAIATHASSVNRWWLRSPSENERYIRTVMSAGELQGANEHRSQYIGVVPALCIE